jgi:threonine synthase
VLGEEPVHTSLEALKSRSVVKHRLPATTAAVRAYVEQHAV